MLFNEGKNIPRPYGLSDKVLGLLKVRVHISIADAVKSSKRLFAFESFKFGIRL